MRSYGIVRSKFWAWAKEKGLSRDAQLFGLYSLTCEHVNGTGCYRLPLAYAAEDLGTVSATVRKTVAELAKAGFLRHDEATGWIWLPGFLEHNPIANSNVGKSLVPFIEAVPRKLPFYNDFLDALEGANVASSDGKRRFPDGFLDRLRNGIGNGMANGMPTHEHEHEHDAGAPADDAELQAFNAWNEAAARVGRWPKVRKLDADRKGKIRARLKDCGGIDAFLAVLVRAEASRFCREEMAAFALDWFLKPANFRKIEEGNYDDKRQKAAPTGRADVLADVVTMFRDREQVNA
jgi:hypothetical protein